MYIYIVQEVKQLKGFNAYINRQLQSVQDCMHGEICIVYFGYKGSNMFANAAHQSSSSTRIMEAHGVINQ